LDRRRGAARRICSATSKHLPNTGCENEQHDPAIGTDPSAVEGGGNLLAADGWKAERQKVILGHGGRGVPRSRQRVGFSNRILRQIKSLRYFRHPKSAPVMNTMG
jgi:hypothetical protein